MQENMIEIDKKELCRLKKAKEIKRVFCLPMLWVMLVTYSLVGLSFILYGIFQCRTVGSKDILSGIRRWA